MKSEHADEPHAPPASVPPPEASMTQDAVAASAAPTQAVAWWPRVVAGLALVGAVGTVSLWWQLGHIREQLARQSADTGSQAVEAKAASKQAEELARETAAKLAVTEAKLAEVSLQRSQLEELMQSLSRSRDENLVVDIESALRLAQQQAQLTGSVQPLLAALKSAEQRLSKVAQPRLAPLQRAITRDIERVKSAAVTDTPGLLLKLDELVRAVDGLPLLNAVGSAPAAPVAAPEPASQSWARAISLTWWERVLADVWNDTVNLVRISRIDRPEASLLAPDQSYFVRENLKLRLLNARLGLLARQFDAVQSDVRQAVGDLEKYFDSRSRAGQSALALAREVLNQSRQTELPRIDDTLAALTTAAAGR